jgi:hypothetical protein
MFEMIANNADFCLNLAAGTVNSCYLSVNDAGVEMNDLRGYACCRAVDGGREVSAVGNSTEMFACRVSGVGNRVVDGRMAVCYVH